MPPDAKEPRLLPLARARTRVYKGGKELPLGVTGTPQPVCCNSGDVVRTPLTNNKRCFLDSTSAYILNPPSTPIHPSQPSPSPASLHPHPGELGKFATHMARVLARKGWEFFFVSSLIIDNPPSFHSPPLDAPPKG